MGRYRASEYYDKAFELEKYNCSYKDTVYYPMWQKVLTYLDEKDRILELGCGTGQFGEMLMIEMSAIATFRPHNYMGVDFSAVGVRKAQERAGNYFALHDIRKPVMFYMYNTVICLETLEHIDNDIVVIQNLEAGTKFIGSVPIANDPAHVRVFQTPESIKERYGSMIDIQEICKFDTKHVFKGYIK